MKKICSLILICALSLSCFVGCDLFSEYTSYKTMNAHIDSTEGYEVTVAVTTNGETLESFYDVEYRDESLKVAYKYEVLNKIDLENPTKGYTSEKSGEAIIKDGKVDSFTGYKINVIPTRLSFDFDQKYFRNAHDSVNEAGDLVFDADVSNPDGFFGKKVSATGMTLHVEYTDKGFKTIKINYGTLVSTVEMVYTFD